MIKLKNGESHLAGQSCQIKDYLAGLSRQIKNYLVGPSRQIKKYLAGHLISLLFVLSFANLSAISFYGFILCYYHLSTAKSCYYILILLVSYFLVVSYSMVFCSVCADICLLVLKVRILLPAGLAEH